MLSFKKFAGLSLPTILSIGAVATVLMTTLALLALLNYSARITECQHAGESLQQLAWQMSDSLERGMQDRFAALETLSAVEQFQDEKNPQQIRRLLEQHQKSFPTFAWLGFAKPDGVVQAAVHGLLEGHDVSARPWFKGGVNAPFTGDYHPALMLEKKLPVQAEPWRFVDFSFPLVRDDGSLRGVLGAHLSWTWARELASAMLDPVVRRYGVEIIVVREDGTVILGPAEVLEKKLALTSLQAATASKSGYTREIWPDGRAYFTGYASANSTERAHTLHWRVLVRQPEAQALAAFSRQQQNFLMLAAGVAILIALLSVWFGIRMARPLVKLSTALVERNGVVTSHNPLPKVGGFLEVQQLTEALAAMIVREGMYREDARLLHQDLQRLLDARSDDAAEHKGVDGI